LAANGDVTGNTWPSTPAHHLFAREVSYGRCTITSSNTAAAQTPIPPRPAVPQEILDLASAPLFRGEYRGTEHATVREGLPLFGTKGTSTREVAFSNDFNILRTTGPMVSYGASTYADALRAARELAYDWSDPSLGGQIYASVGVAVLQASDGAYFSALIGSGKQQTSGSALGYRSDGYDNNVHGSIDRATDARPTTPWTAPVDGDGKPVDIAPPADDREIAARKVTDVKVDKLVPATPMLKAVIDIRELFEIS
jgi:hypothetical protein